MNDVQGLDRLSRRLFGHGTHALAGMLQHAVALPRVRERPVIGLTVADGTTACAQAVAAALEPGHDCLVLHATGTGGRSLERLIEHGLVEGVIDITLVEVADHLLGGLASAGEERLEAVIRTGLPYVGAAGALDRVSFGAPSSLPPACRERWLHAPGDGVTLMRTSAADNVVLGRWLAAKLNRMSGPVRFLLPEGGLSDLDGPGGRFHDPAADRALFDTLFAETRQMHERRLIRRPEAINDPAFAAALVAAFAEIAD